MFVYAFFWCVCDVALYYCGLLIVRDRALYDITTLEVRIDRKAQDWKRSIDTERKQSIAEKAQDAHGTWEDNVTFGKHRYRRGAVMLGAIG